MKITYFEVAMRWLGVDPRFIFCKFIEIPYQTIVRKEADVIIDGICVLFFNFATPKGIFGLANTEMVERIFGGFRR